jgi:hypothetical protein
VHRVQQPHHFRRALTQVARVALERHESTDVDVPQIHARLAAHDPLGERLAGARRRRDAHRVEAGGDEETPQLGRLAQHVAVVRREALGPIDVAPHRRRFEDRNANDRLLHEHAKVLPVIGQQREREILGHAVHAPRLGHRLEATHEQPADLLAHVDVAVGVTEHRQVAAHAVQRLGDDVEVLGGVQRHVDAGHAADVAPPQAGAVHHDLTRDVAVIRAHAGHDVAVARDTGDGHILDDRRAALSRALGERERGVDRVRAPVARDPHRAGEVIGAHERPEPSGFTRRDDFDVDAEAFRHRRAALELGHALGRPRHADAAGPPEARGLAGLGLELFVEDGAVARETREIVAGAQLADEARGVPRRAARELPTLQHDHVAPAELGQVIRHAAADDPPADDHEARVRRERPGHRRTIAHRAVAQPSPRSAVRCGVAQAARSQRVTAGVTSESGRYRSRSHDTSTSPTPASTPTTMSAAMSANAVRYGAPAIRHPPPRR